MNQRIGTADNYAIEDEHRWAEERRRVLEQGRTYARTPEVLRWLDELAAWRRGGMAGDAPTAPDLSAGEVDVHSGATRPCDLSREDLRGADLGGQSPGLAAMLTPRGPLEPAWARIRCTLPGEQDACIDEVDVSHAALVAVIRLMHLPSVAGRPVRRGPRYDAILDALSDAGQVYAQAVVGILATAELREALDERYTEGNT
jgi:hypothetical protein